MWQLKKEYLVYKLLECPTLSSRFTGEVKKDFPVYTVYNVPFTVRDCLGAEYSELVS